MSLENDLKVLAALKADKDKITESIDEQLQYIVDNYSPVKIGDIVVVTGYSHKGKKMQVSYVHYNADGWRKGFNARGKVFKADGSLGKFDGEWNESRKL